MESLSVVFPVFDEEANVEPLVRDIVAAVRPLRLPFEVVAPVRKPLGGLNRSPE